MGTRWARWRSSGSCAQGTVAAAAAAAGPAADDEAVAAAVAAPCARELPAWARKISSDARRSGRARDLRGAGEHGGPTATMPQMRPALVLATAGNPILPIHAISYITASGASSLRGEALAAPRRAAAALCCAAARLHSRAQTSYTAPLSPTRNSAAAAAWAHHARPLASLAAASSAHRARRPRAAHAAASSAAAAAAGAARPATRGRPPLAAHSLAAPRLSSSLPPPLSPGWHLGSSGEPRRWGPPAAGRPQRSLCIACVRPLPPSAPASAVGGGGG